MTRLSKIYKKGKGLVLSDEKDEDELNKWNNNDSIEYKTIGNGDILEFEEELINSKNKKKRYLNPNAKAFMHKFLKMMK